MVTEEDGGRKNVCFHTCLLSLVLFSADAFIIFKSFLLFCCLFTFFSTFFALTRNLIFSRPIPFLYFGTGFYLFNDPSQNK